MDSLSEGNSRATLKASRSTYHRWSGVVLLSREGGRHRLECHVAAAREELGDDGLPGAGRSWTVALRRRWATVRAQKRSPRPGPGGGPARRCLPALRAGGRRLAGRAPRRRAAGSLRSVPSAPRATDGHARRGGLPRCQVFGPVPAREGGPGFGCLGLDAEQVGDDHGRQVYEGVHQAVFRAARAGRPYWLRASAKPRGLRGCPGCDRARVSAPGRVAGALLSATATTRRSRPAGVPAKTAHDHPHPAAAELSAPTPHPATHPDQPQDQLSDTA